jgi:DNA polymerase-3 subunit beta
LIHPYIKKKKKRACLSAGGRLTSGCPTVEKAAKFSVSLFEGQGMKVVMQTAELARALYRVQGIADRRAITPILGHVLLSAGDHGLTVSATDQEVGLVGTYDAEVQAAGGIAVQARQLYEVVKAIASPQVTLTRRENNWIDIHGGSSRFHLVGTAADEFPRLPSEETPQSTSQPIQLPATALLQMIDRTSFCVSSDENRHTLSGTYCESPEPHVLRMVSTDGHRLALSEATFEATFDLPQGAIVPRKGFSELRRILGDSNANEQVEVSFHGNIALMKTRGMTLSTLLIEGQFPDYRQVIPQGGGKVVKLPRLEFAEALRRVSLMSQGRAHGVRFAFTEGTAELVAEDPESGDARETLAVDYAGTPLTIGFNARYILDVLGLMNEPDVAFHLSDDLSPGVLRPVEDPRFLAVVMPMRI